jgi:hypothetical protein
VIATDAMQSSLFPTSVCMSGRDSSSIFIIDLRSYSLFDRSAHWGAFCIWCINELEWISSILLSSSVEERAWRPSKTCWWCLSLIFEYRSLWLLNVLYLSDLRRYLFQALDTFECSLLSAGAVRGVKRCVVDMINVFRQTYSYFVVPSYQYDDNFYCCCGLFWFSSMTTFSWSSAVAGSPYFWTHGPSFSACHCISSLAWMERHHAQGSTPLAWMPMFVFVRHCVCLLIYWCDLYRWSALLRCFERLLKCDMCASMSVLMMQSRCVSWSHFCMPTLAFKIFDANQCMNMRAF